MENSKEDNPEAPKKGRPPKFSKSYIEKALKLSLLGATDKEMADFFDVAESTLNLWKLKNKAFSESIKKGKREADANVAERLYKRAIGYQYQEEKNEYENGDEKPVRKSITVKTLAPDPTAQIFWLKNRQPELWRDTKNIDHTTGGKPIREYTEEDIDKELKDILTDAGD